MARNSKRPAPPAVHTDADPAQWTLVWADEADAEGDDGSQAVAVIVRRGEVAL